MAKPSCERSASRGTNGSGYEIHNMRPRGSRSLATARRHRPDLRGNYLDRQGVIYEGSTSRADFLILVGGLLLTNAQSVFASCIPPRANDSHWAGFSGTQGALSGVKGVSASIEEYTPYVSGGSESLMWVMLSVGTTKWSQIGWWRDSSGRRIFEQHTAVGAYYTNYWPASMNNPTNYKVVTSSAPPNKLIWKFYVDGSLRSTPLRDWAPTGYQLYGETHNAADQMSGGFTSLATKAAMTNPLKQNSSGTWSAVTTSAGANNTTWYGAQLTSGVYYIWDKACAS